MPRHRLDPYRCPAHCERDDEQLVAVDSYGWLVGNPGRCAVCGREREPSGEPLDPMDLRAR
jgi:hypothetical protein